MDDLSATAQSLVHAIQWSERAKLKPHRAKSGLLSARFSVWSRTRKTSVLFGYLSR